MAKKMLINALHAEEARVAIVEDGRLVDLDVEIAGNEQIRGNIYKGVVVRVEPGLQAAFVDIGLKKLGFLQMGELHPDNWKWRDDIPEEQRHRRPRIQEVLRRGQELIVQVEKGERDNKGSALTTYASLPGRYMVLMPGSDSSGISRKVEAEGERKKLKEIISEMTIPEGYGYIIRTEAMGRTRDELQKDLDSLIALYEGIKSQGEAMKGAGLIYQESALIIRTIRDYFSADIDEVLVDSKDVYKDVREALKEIDPQFEKLVKMHQEKRPIFSRYQLEEQIDLIYEKKVPLKSGGSIFIEPTEALVSIDVNSGKSTGEKGVEDTAFKTNMEAAEEAARQLRLRDLGGLIVIDFIDMRDRKHNVEVERTLKSALKADKARVNVSRISEFGLLEMSRQRIRQTLNQASTLECPHCDGRGKVKSVEAMALSFLRKVHAAAAKGTIAEVVGSLPLEVAYYLLNRKRRELSGIERDYDIEVTVKGKPSFLLNQMELELVKREKLPQEELPQEKGQLRVQPAKEEGAAAQEAEGRKKKRKGKAKPQAEGAEMPAEALPAPAAAAEVPHPAPVALAEEGGSEGVVAEGEHEEHKKKRRRKRKRGKGGAEAAAGELTAAEAVEVGAELPSLPVAMAGELPPVAAVLEHPIELHPHEEGGEEGKKKRRRKRRRGKGAHEHHEGALHLAHEQGAEGAEPSVSGQQPAAATEAAPEAAGHGEAAAEHVEGAPEKQKKTRRSRGRKGAKGAEAPAEGAMAVAAEAHVAAPAEAAAAPAPAPAPAPAAHAEAAPAAPEAAKPARGRKPREPKAAKAAAGGEARVAGEVMAPTGGIELGEGAAVEPAKAPRRGRKPKGAQAPEAEQRGGEEASAAKPAPRAEEAPKAEPAPKAEEARTDAEAPQERKPAKAQRTPRGAKGAKEPAAPAEATSADKPAAAPAETASAEPAPKAAKPRAPRKKAPAPEQGQEAAPAGEKPKKARAPRRKKEEPPA
jgi:ribonuclease E